MYCAHLFVVCILIAFNISSIVNADNTVSETTSRIYRLYDENYDHIEILDEKNITSSIYESDKSWAVGYYAENKTLSWDFMEVWKKTAEKLHLLSDVSVAVIYCASNNTSKDACIKQNVTSYPTLKYYGPDFKDDSPGILLETVNNATTLALNIIDLMRMYEKTENKSTRTSIQHLYSSDNHNLINNGDTQDFSKKRAAWESTKIFIIYVFIGLLVLTMILWSSYSIIKRLSKREVNVYTVLHKSETNDDDSIQVRLKY